MPQQYPNTETGKLGSYTDEELRRLIPSRVDSNPAQQQYQFTEESWKHHAQARAILSNLIGPNGEQLTSTDPYNTTVFVGGLSPLISEETLRTFFTPFGDIHYVRAHFYVIPIADNSDLSSGLLSSLGQSSCRKTLRFRAVCA